MSNVPFVNLERFSKVGTGIFTQVSKFCVWIQTYDSDTRGPPAFKVAFREETIEAAYRDARRYACWLYGQNYLDELECGEWLLALSLSEQVESNRDLP